MRSWQWVLWVGVGVFILTRVLTLASFPIFNDEAIYIQYTQYIHEDFSQYRLISAGGNAYLDWKPPLQYWLGSIFVGATGDPLLDGRLTSFFISLFGLLGIYLFIRELLGKREAAFAVFLYALLPTALFFNGQYIAETFVFSLAPWMYWAFLKAVRAEKVRWQYAALGAVFGGLLLLAKQSGMMYLGLSILLPLTFLKSGGERQDWRGFFVRLGAIAAGVVGALILRRLGLSAESVQLEDQFNSNWLMGIREVLGFPLGIWKVNWDMVYDYYRYYYSAFILLPIIYFFFITLRQREAWRAAIGLGFLGGSAAVLLLLRGFNEYIYNTATIVFLVPLLAATFFAALQKIGPRVLWTLTLASFVGLGAHWVYQDALMKVSPADYIRRSTPWAVRGYLENWSGGFGVAEAIAYVKGQEGPGLVLADPQWGNPRTALEVYNATSPRTMQIIGLTSDFQTAAGTLAAKEFILAQPFKTRLVVFSAARNETRAVWQDNVTNFLCDNRKEIQIEPTQPPIIICSF